MASDIVRHRFASSLYSEALASRENASSIFFPLAFPGASSWRMRSIVFRYATSEALVAAGALRYFSKRARSSRLLLMFQILPSKDITSLPGSKEGTSRPMNPSFICGGRAPPVAARESPAPLSSAAAAAVAERTATKIRLPFMIWSTPWRRGFRFPAPRQENGTAGPSGCLALPGRAEAPGGWGSRSPWARRRSGDPPRLTTRSS